MKMIIQPIVFVLLISNISYTQSQKKDTTFLKPKAVNADLSVIIPPKDFVVATQFNGYINKEYSSAITLTMLENISYPIMEKSISEAFYQKNQLTLLSKEKVKTQSNLKGLAYKCLFKVKETELIRYIFFVGDLNKTLWINVTYPKSFDDLMGEEILKSIETIKFK